MGAQAELLMTYALIYPKSVLQHSNVRWQLGALNYIFATGQLHQWHHQLTKTVTTKHWDWIFGTRILQIRHLHVGAKEPIAAKPNPILALYLLAIP